MFLSKPHCLDQTSRADGIPARRFQCFSRRKIATPIFAAVGFFYENKLYSSEKGKDACLTVWYGAIMEAFDARVVSARPQNQV